jgi:hypothetical protein
MVLINTKGSVYALVAYARTSVSVSRQSDSFALASLAALPEKNRSQIAIDWCG